jgi:hypothetical protein
MIAVKGEPTPFQLCKPFVARSLRLDADLHPRLSSTTSLDPQLDGFERFDAAQVFGLLGKQVGREDLRHDAAELWNVSVGW